MSVVDCLDAPEPVIMPCSPRAPPVIISASRRTDVPAFYAEWMVRRFRAGYCTVANPYNRNQVTRISLKPEDVDAIDFWVG